MIVIKKNLFSIYKLSNLLISDQLMMQRRHINASKRCKYSNGLPVLNTIPNTISNRKKHSIEKVVRVSY